MLSALFPIQTSSLISFHEHSSVLVHQCTTLKQLPSVLSSVDTIDNALHRHPDIPRANIPLPPSNLKSTHPYYTNTVLPIEECRHPDIPRADIPPPPKQPQVYTAILHQYSITYRRMQTSWHTKGRHSSVIVDQQLKLNKIKDNITN